jgi:predicted Rossmann fold nucleotide-binding protein DprA/Smf involved in DNA uptake
MELDSSLSWLALALTPGLAPRLSARLLQRFNSPDAAFRAPLVRAEQPEAKQRNLLVAASLNPSEKKDYELLSAEESKHIDDIVERSSLNSSEVLATLFDLEMKGLVRQSPGKQFSKVLF